MSNIDTMFADMAAAPMNSKGNYMGEGVFVVETKVIKAKDGYKGKSFIIEFRILESSNPDHPVGSSASQVIKLDKAQAWGDVKAFMFALAMGLDPKTVKDPKQNPKLHEEVSALVKAAISEEHAKLLKQEPDFLIGLPVRLETVKIKTGAGKDFTVHNWSPYEDAEQELSVAA